MHSNFMTFSRGVGGGIKCYAFSTRSFLSTIKFISLCYCISSVEIGGETSSKKGCIFDRC